MRTEQIFINTRDALGKMRRRDLEALAKKHRIQVSHDMPAYEMAEILRGHNITPDAPELLEEAAKIEDMSFFELRNECKARGLPWKKTDKKADLIKRLEA